MSSLPSGTVTFVFTDIEGSTKLLQELGDEYADVARDHRRIVRERFADAGGTEIDTQGDAFFFSFPRARDAVRGAVDAQRALRDHDWPQGRQVRVRMGLHTGEPTLGDEGYLGMDVVRAARISSAGHGGQILLSETTRALVGNDLPAGATVHDLGATALKDVQHEHIYELAVDGDSGFPPLKADAPKSSSDLLAERIERQVEEQILAGFSRTQSAGKPVVGKPVRQAANGLIILAMTILTLALIVGGIVLLAKLVL